MQAKQPRQLQIIAIGKKMPGQSQPIDELHRQIRLINEGLNLQTQATNTLLQHLAQSELQSAQHHLLVQLLLGRICEKLGIDPKESMRDADNVVSGKLSDLLSGRPGKRI